MYNNIVRLNSFHVDSGGRRSGQDRRRFAYSNHIPERRLGKEHGLSRDRRSGKDRRKVVRGKPYLDMRNGRRFERRVVHRQLNEELQQSDFCL
jgi:hypothetical protein